VRISRYGTHVSKRRPDSDSSLGPLVCPCRLGRPRNGHLPFFSRHNRNVSHTLAADRRSHGIGRPRPGSLAAAHRSSYRRMGTSGPTCSDSRDHLVADVCRLHVLDRGAFCRVNTRRLQGACNLGFARSLRSRIGFALGAAYPLLGPGSWRTSSEDRKSVGRCPSACSRPGLASRSTPTWYRLGAALSCFGVGPGGRVPAVEAQVRRAATRESGQSSRPRRGRRRGLELARIMHEG